MDAVDKPDVSQLQYAVKCCFCGEIPEFFFDEEGEVWDGSHMCYQYNLRCVLNYPTKLEAVKARNEMNV